jgi:WD40 repeat protein
VALAAIWRKGPPVLFDAASGAEVRTLAGGGDFSQIAFSPDGKLLAAGGLDGQLRVWDVASGGLVRKFLSSGLGEAFSVAFSPDGKVLAAGFADGSVSLWDVTSGWQVGTLPKQGGQVRWVGFHPDGRSLAIAGQWRDNHVLVYDLATGKETHRLPGHESGVLSGGWRADGKLLVAVGETDGTLRAWNLGVTSPRPLTLRIFPANTRWLHSVALTAEGRFAAVAAPDGLIPIVSIPGPPPPYHPCPAGPVRSPKELASQAAAADALKRANIPASLLNLAGKGDPARVPPEVIAILGDARFRLPKAGQSSWIATDREGKFLAVPVADVVAIFDTRTGEVVRALTGSTDRIYAVAFSPDGRFVAGGNWTGDKKKSSAVKVWDLETGEVTVSLDSGAGNIFGVNFSRDGKHLFASSFGAVQMWDMTGKLVRTFRAYADAHGFYHLGLSPDGKRLVCNDMPTTAKVWDIEGDKQPVTLGGHTSHPLYAAYSPDGKLLATGSDKELLLWDAEKLELVKKIATPAAWLAFAPDGKTMLSAKHHTGRPLEKDVVTRWDLTTYEGKPLPPLTRRNGWPVYHLSPEGKTLYSLVADGPDREQRVRAYDAATGKELFPRQGHKGQVWSVAFSAGGKALASVSDDPAIRLWDVATGKFERALPNEQGFWSVAFSPDGKRIAAGELDGTVVLHDATTGEKLRTLPGPKSQVRAVAFSPDGRLVAGTTTLGIVHVWEAASGRLRHVLPGHRGPSAWSWSLAFSADGKTLATGWAEGDVILFDVATGWEVADLRVGVGDVRWLGFHPDGRSLGVVGNQTGAPLWSSNTRHPGFPQVFGGPASAMLAAGQVLGIGGSVTSGNGKFRLDMQHDRNLVLYRTWDGLPIWAGNMPRRGGSQAVMQADGNFVLHGAPFQTGTNGHPGACFVVQDDGNMVVYHPREVTFGVWDLATGKEIRRMAPGGRPDRHGHIGGAWRADGLLLASCSASEGTVHLWSTDGKPERDQVIRLFAPQTQWLHGLAMSPEGRHLATANPDGTVTILRLARPGEVFEPTGQAIQK